MVFPELSSNSKDSFRLKYLQKAYYFFGQLKAFDLLVIIICMASFGCSWIESMVNSDSMHWGWPYIAALDLKRGLIPHLETLTFYGYLHSWIQSIALTVFGERLMSLGIITGLFYSFTLLFSYLVFLKFLKKNLAFISVLLIFLIHPYIIYVHSNYFAYTFHLLALIFFLRYSDNSYNGFLAGFFLCMSLLSRYSSVIAILPPFIILLFWDYFVAKGEKIIVIKKIVLVASGFFIPLIIFFTYLALNSALGAFFYQNKMLIYELGKVDDIETYLNFFASLVQVVPSLADDFRGKLFTLIFIISLFILIKEGIQLYSNTAKKSETVGYEIMAVCLVTIFGYLNCVHVYETLRLVNGSSLGVGLCVFVFYNYFIKANRSVKYFMVFLSALTFLFLSSTLFFRQTTSSYYPWKPDVLLHSGVKNETIGLLKGKIMSKEYNDFYQEVFDAIEPYKDSCYILNYTRDCVALAINDLPRVQISPVNFTWLDDTSKQAELIEKKKAVILSFKAFDFPGYKKIFNKQWPDEIPWLGGGYLFIYAPIHYCGDDRISPDQTNHNKSN